MNAQHDDDSRAELGAELRRLVPEPPFAPDRPATTLRRGKARRRRRTTAVVLGAAAVVAVAAVGVPTLTGGEGSNDSVEFADPVQTTTPEPTIEPTTTTSEPVSSGPVRPECPEPDPDLADAGPLPRGATSVSLCPGPGTDFVPPADQLVTRVDQFIDLVGSRAAGDYSGYCVEDPGPSRLYVLDYPDGTQRQVETQFNCGIVLGAGEPRQDAFTVDTAFVDGITRQRGLEHGGELPETELTCPDPLYALDDTPTFVTADTTQALLCSTREEPGLDGAVSDWQSAELSGADLDTLLGDLADPEAAPVESGCPDDRTMALVMLTDRGDVGVLDASCGIWGRNGNDETRENYADRRLGAEAQAVVDRLVP